MYLFLWWLMSFFLLLSIFGEDIIDGVLCHYIWCVIIIIIYIYINTCSVVGL